MAASIVTAGSAKFSESQRLIKSSIITFPPSVVASWPPPNYLNPQKRGPALYIINAVILSITLCCVALRLYARIWIRRWFGLDDLFIILGVMGTIGVTTCVLLGFHSFDWDRHIYDIHLDVITSSGQTLYASKILWSLASNAVRASVMCLYYRLLDHIGLNQYRWLLHINSLFIFGIFLEQQFSVVLSCTPIKAIWTWPVITDAHCINIAASLKAGVVLNTASEFLVACLPIPVIMTLNIEHKQRWAVVALLCGGFFVVICGCARTYYLWLVVDGYDPTWWAMPHWICSEIELDAAIICASLPALRPVLGRTFIRRKIGNELPAVENPAAVPAVWTKRSRALFSKSVTSLRIKSVSNDKRERLSYDGNPSNALYVDLEGIGNDGLGYSVTIRTDHGTKVRKRWDVRNKTWHYYPEEPDLASTPSSP